MLLIAVLVGFFAWFGCIIFSRTSVVCICSSRLSTHITNTIFLIGGQAILSQLLGSGLGASSVADCRELPRHNDAGIQGIV
jgi:hypothetical protein